MPLNGPYFQTQDWTQDGLLRLGATSFFYTLDTNPSVKLLGASFDLD